MSSEISHLRRLLRLLARRTLLRLALEEGLAFAPGYTAKETLVGALGRLPGLDFTDLLFDRLTAQELHQLCKRAGIEPGGLGPDVLAIRVRAVIAAWRPFREARAFARGLSLSGPTQWRRFCRGELPDCQASLPRDVPARPHVIYAAEGWIDYHDWLSEPAPAPREE